MEGAGRQPGSRGRRLLPAGSTGRQRAAGWAAVLLMAGCVPAQAATAPGDAAALQQVVESFRLSVIRKDKPAFLQLFFSDLPERITWQAVVDDASLRRIRQTQPQAIKARYRPDNNLLTFIDGVVNSPQSQEERFQDVVIDSDGEVASISFDYVYLADGRPTNHGREKWLLVRTEAGWKITSVVYTIRLPEPAGHTP